MKKILSTILAVLLMITILPTGLFSITVNAIKVNYCNDFEQAIYNLDYFQSFEDGYKGDVSQSSPFSADVIYPYTFYNIEILKKFDKENKITIETIGTTSNISAPKEVFETASKNLFKNVDINILREKYLENNSYTISAGYDGFGGARGYKIVGYIVDGDIFTTYGYQGCRMSENEVSSTDKFLYTGEKMLDGSNEVLVCEKCFKINLSYSNQIIMFHSWETINNIPNRDELITPDTKVDTPNENISSGNQSSTTQSNNSKPNSSNPSQSQNSSTGHPDSSSSKSSVTTTSTLQKTPSSNQDITSQTNTETSSSATNTEPSKLENEIGKTDTTEGIEENSEQSNTSNNFNKKTKNNHFVMILAIISVIILLSVSVTVYLLKFKKKE